MAARSEQPVKRQARVTVKYDRAELRRRLELEKWIEERLESLYQDQEDALPDDLSIDDLIDMRSDDERIAELREKLKKCRNETESFVAQLVVKLRGVQKEAELQSVAHPALGHAHQRRHEPYSFHGDAK